jgi:hypothetical protein
MKREGCGYLWTIWAVTHLSTMLGCGPGAAPSVTGKITLDGSSLDQATITFIPQAGSQSQAAWATTTNGNYDISPASGLGTGNFRVEIRALRPVTGGSPQNDPTLIAAKEAVPSKYNSNSELSVDIKPGPNTANFELRSK